MALALDEQDTYHLEEDSGHVLLPERRPGMWQVMQRMPFQSFYLYCGMSTKSTAVCAKSLGAPLGTRTHLGFSMPKVTQREMELVIEGNLARLEDSSKC